MNEYTISDVSKELGIPSSTLRYCKNSISDLQINTKKLDERAKLPAFITALSIGIIGALIFGTGMCFALGQFGAGGLFIAVGIVLGLVGAAICITNYPLYKKLLKKGKEKYAFEILELAKEITEKA